MHEKDILEALSSSQVLASMITPAVLISACGTLIFSTSGRLGRLFDRVNAYKGEVEGVMARKLAFPEERMAYISEQLGVQQIRAGLLQKSMAALYTATALFIASSLAIAINVAFGSPDTRWVPTGIALAGGLFLFASSALLLYESRYNLRFINRQIEFVNAMKAHAQARPEGDRE